MSDKRQHVDALQTIPGRVNNLILAQKPHQPLESAHILRLSFRWLNEKMFEKQMFYPIATTSGVFGPNTRMIPTTTRVER